MENFILCVFSLCVKYIPSSHGQDEMEVRIPVSSVWKHKKINLKFLRNGSFQILIMKYKARFYCKLSVCTHDPSSPFHRGPFSTPLSLR